MPSNNPNCRKTLRPPWQKGCPSPNPGGKPKRNMITRALIRELRKKIPNDAKGRTHLEKLAEAIVTAAGKAKIAAFIALTDRVEGKATQPIEASGDIPVQIIFD